MMQREACLDLLHRLRPPTAVVVSTMAAVAPWHRRSSTVLDFPSCGSAMGHAADFGLGIALARPAREVWIFNGDGSMLMNLGTLVTIAHSSPANLTLFIFQNNTFEVTGNQPIPGAGRIDLTTMALGAGFPTVAGFNDSSVLAEQLPQILGEQGPRFVNLRIEPGAEPPPMLDCSARVPAHQLREALQEL